MKRERQRGKAPCQAVQAGQVQFGVIFLSSYVVLDWHDIHGGSSRCLFRAPLGPHNVTHTRKGGVLRQEFEIDISNPTHRHRARKEKNPTPSPPMSKDLSTATNSIF